jgi:hypothetical protein
MVNKNVSHVITVTTNCQEISQSSRGDETLKFRSFEFNTNVGKFGKELFQQLSTYCNGLYFVILTGSHYLHKNIFVKRNIHCYLNKFYEINSLYLHLYL